MKSSATVPLLLVLLGACRAPQVDYPPGPGLAAADRQPPAEAMLYSRPIWHTGDWFDYRRGGHLRLRFEVQALPAEASDGQGVSGYLFRNSETGRTQVFDADFGTLGDSANPGPDFGLAGPYDLLLDPVDPTLAWPLWVGKRWSGGFVNRQKGKAPLPFRVFYDVQALESVSLPAGRFEALRIQRRVSLALDGNYIDRVSLLWYAPQLGCIVRRLEDSIVTELEAYQLQGAP